MNKRIDGMKHDLKPTYVLCRQYTPQKGDQCMCGKPYLSHTPASTMSTQDCKREILTSFENRFKRWRVRWVLSDSAESIKNFLSNSLDRMREETLNEYYRAVDARYKDYEVTVAMGEILQELKEKPKA